MTFGKRRYHHAVDSQILQQNAALITSTIESIAPTSMEMNLADRDSVSLSTLPRHNLKHPARQIFNAVRCIQTIDDLENVMNVAVDVRMHMIVGVSVIMAVLMVVGVSVIMAVLMVVSVFMIVMMLMVVLIMAMFVVVMMLFFL